MRLWAPEREAAAELRVDLGLINDQGNLEQNSMFPA